MPDGVAALRVLVLTGFMAANSLIGSKTRFGRRKPPLKKLDVSAVLQKETFVRVQKETA
jgi:hypothetical protein